MTTEAEFIELAIYTAIAKGHCMPDKQYYSEGYMACRDGLAFHERPYDMFSVAGLSWRIGWNDYALANAQS